MRLEQYLTEKTFAIGADVDLVYKKLYEPYTKEIKKGNYGKVIQLLDKHKSKTPLVYVSSGELKSKQAKTAHEINPIIIGFYADNLGNYYSPNDKIIHYSFNYNVIDIIRANRGDIVATKRTLPDNQRDRFENELNDIALKGTIYHELSHWLDDTLHNQHIKKMIDLGLNDPNPVSVASQGHADPVLTVYELDAQIHALKQMKRQLKGKYNDIWWDDVFTLKPSFYSVFNKAAVSKEYDEYMKRLTKRMHREGLLTKKLQRYPTDVEMFKLLRKGKR